MAEAKTKTKSYETDKEVIRIMFDKWKSNDEAQKREFREWAVKQFDAMVKSVATKHYSSLMSDTSPHRNDLLQSGWLGIFSHAASYDPDRAGLYVYFAPIIQHEMMAYINHNIRNMSRHSYGNYKKVKAAIEALNQRGNTNPSTNDIANECGLRAAVVLRTLEQMTLRESFSFEEMEHVTATEKTNPEVLLEKKEQKESIQIAMTQSLKPLEREVVCRKFGIMGYERQNTHEIARDLSIGTDQIARIATNSLTKLRSNPAISRHRTGKRQEILRDLEREAVVITPDSAAERMMRQLQLSEDTDDILF